ncbi:head-to-tail stopper [Mycobacterium phage Muddy]|uniref:Head-to-tail stopper n=2 Tax=Mycobacterium phage Muddy TaxID=1340829 RepID=S5YB02_9CAUD|nr:head-to-tail stopper [Mycobacterium phage Muddy]WEV84056.1 head-to-tail stopper [Mycobacterium phage Muddy]
MSVPDVFLPLLYSVDHSAYDATATNDLGDPIPDWQEPVERDVYGWGPPQQETPKEVIVGDDRIRVELELMVPPGWQSKHRDKFDLGYGDDVVYYQVGPVEDYEHNPFGWNPGSVVNLVSIKGVL